MKTYVIPVSGDFTYNFNHYVIVYANTVEEAYKKADTMIETKDRLVSENFDEYICFNGQLEFPMRIFHDSNFDVIIKSLQDQSNQIESDEKDTMSDLLYDFIYMKDYNKNIEDLVNLAIPEQWNFPNETGNTILKNYLSKTLERLQEEGKVITTDKFCTFNTGLFTPYYESIYLVAEKSTSSNTQKEWVFKEFCTEYKLYSTDISTLPERANYFKDPSLLIFDWNYPVRVQYGHILVDNSNRLPKSISESKIKLQTLTGVIDTSIKRVIANYKLAVPQYYDGKIQLLIPLFFDNETKPDLALTVTKKDGYYQGHTCITLEMAYNNARLIAKPESTWLTI